jgi:hypothetical protein
MMAESEQRMVHETIHLTDQVSVAMRHYLAQHHLWTSRHAADRCRELETQLGIRRKRDIEHESFAITSILSGVAFLEALVNETFEDVGDPDYESYRKPALDSNIRKDMTNWASKKLRVAGLLEKYNAALRLAGAAPFIQQENPYHDVTLLIKLRKALMHFRPAWHDQGAIDELGNELSKRFTPSSLLPEEDGSPWVPVKALGASGAEWAYRTAEAFADDWIGRLGISENYHEGMAWWEEQRQARIGSNVQRQET